MSLPVKVHFIVARASQINLLLPARRAVGKGAMGVSDIVKEVYLLLLQHQRCCYRMDRRVAPSLVEEAAFLIKMIEIVEVGLGAEPV